MMQLRTHILDGVYPIGARLPAERRLAEILGVNRVTVRSALGHLAGAGLLSVRQGAGYEVNDFHRRGGPGLIKAIASRSKQRGEFEDTAADMLLVRRQLAAGLLERLVARPPSAQALVRIFAAVDDFESSSMQGASSERLAGLDLEIIGRLVEATGSSVLGLCINPIVAALAAFPSLRDAIYANPAGNVMGWRGICSWLTDPHEEAMSLILEALRERDQQTLQSLFGTESS